MNRLVSLTDKMDTIAGMFAINKPPSGTVDPFGLRRAALGIVKILFEKGWSPGLNRFMNQALDNLPDEVFKVDQAEVRQQVRDFFQARLQHFFTGHGFDHDVVEAVLAEYFDDPAGAKGRIEALQEYKNSPDFAEGAIAFKRLFNILKDQKPPQQTDPALFQQDEEKNLHQASQAAADQVRGSAKEGRYSEVLTELTKLKPMVDTFFDEVMVMDENDSLRKNRLALVASVADLFRLVADFSKLQAS